MIAKLRGTVDSLAEDAVILDVGGVGYLVVCSTRTLGRLSPGEAAVLLTEHVVREDKVTLYGFLTAAEQDFFRLLTSVQGVGAKVALSILAVAPVEQLAQAVAAQDKTTLARASGVGPKLATRVVAELKDKVGGIGPLPVAGATAAPGLSPAPVISLGTAAEEAISALANLGYARLEAMAAVARAGQSLGAEASTQALLGAALRDLGKGL